MGLRICVGSPFVVKELLWARRVSMGSLGVYSVFGLVLIVA